MDFKLALKLTLTLLILLFNLHLLEGQTKYPLKIDFINVGTSSCKYDQDLSTDVNAMKYNYMYGALRIENKSDSTYSFWIMYCSWTDLVKVEPENIWLYVRKCDVNFPKMISLGSHESILFNSIVEIPIEYYNKSVTKSNTEIANTFKIGFIIINEKDGNQYWNARIKKIKENDYIWTDPIKIEFKNYRWEIL